MKDIQGKELYIGDLVVVMSSLLDGLGIGIIVNFCDSEDGLAEAIVSCGDLTIEATSTKVFKCAEEVHTCLNCTYDEPKYYESHCVDCFRDGYDITPSAWKYDGICMTYKERVSDYL